MQRSLEQGRTFSTASNEQVTEEGARRILTTVNGTPKGLNMRVMKVSKALMSVYDMVQAGHCVVFDSKPDGTDSSYALHKEAGAVTPFTLRNRVWEISCNVVPHKDAESF